MWQLILRKVISNHLYRGCSTAGQIALMHTEFAMVGTEGPRECYYSCRREIRRISGQSGLLHVQSIFLYKM